MRKNIQITFSKKFMPMLAHFNTETLLKLDFTRTTKAAIREHMQGKTLAIPMHATIRDAAKHRSPPPYYTIPITEDDEDIAEFYYALPRGRREEIIGDLLAKAFAAANKPQLTKTDYEAAKVDNTAPYPITEDFSNTTPGAVEYKGARIDLKYWKDLFPAVCNLLAKDHTDKVRDIVKIGMRGRGDNYYLSPENHSPEKMISLNDIEGFVNATLGAKQSCEQSVALLKKLGLPESTLTIYLKSDRRPFKEKRLS